MQHVQSTCKNITTSNMYSTVCMLTCKNHVTKNLVLLEELSPPQRVSVWVTEGVPINNPLCPWHVRTCKSNMIFFVLIGATCMSWIVQHACWIHVDMLFFATCNFNWCWHAACCNMHVLNFATCNFDSCWHACFCNMHVLNYATCNFTWCWHAFFRNMQFELMLTCIFVQHECLNYATCNFTWCWHAHVISMHVNMQFYLNMHVGCSQHGPFFLMRKAFWTLSKARGVARWATEGAART